MARPPPLLMAFEASLMVYTIFPCFFFVDNNMAYDFRIRMSWRRDSCARKYTRFIQKEILGFGRFWFFFCRLQCAMRLYSNYVLFFDISFGYYEYLRQTVILHSFTLWMCVLNTALYSRQKVFPVIYICISIVYIFI